MPAYKYGRLPGYVPNGLRELPFYKAGSLPRPPAKVAVPAVAPAPDGTPWGMDGNDSKGDCGVAGIDHGFMAAAAAVKVTAREAWPTDQAIIDYYLTYTGGQDTGVVLADFLAYVQKQKFFGHTVQAYAPIGVHDIPALCYAIYAYTYAYTGINVTQAMESAFQQGKPWTLADLFSPVAGGHCVPLVGYDSDYLYCVTWGKIQPISYSAWHFISDEAWAVISGEFQTNQGDGRGIDLAALQADLVKLAA
jgi:hypothetical protein